MSFQFLYAAVQRRKRPEDVADAILRVLGSELSAVERAMISVAAKGALRRRLGAYTSMLEDFARPVGFDRQAGSAARLFELPRIDDPSDPVKVEAFVREAGARIHKAYGRSSFLYDRLNREVRRSVGVGDSRRAYNRKFRILARMERKLVSYARQLRQLELTRVGKSGLATMLSYEELTRDPSSACFIAYYTARCNLRSEFTISGQQRPFDTIAATLFERCERSETTSWWAIAHVFPTPEVLARLGDDEKGRLLSRWTDLLHEIAGLLEQTWRRSRFDRNWMIVKRGDDSTTWNQLARAWNTARDHWMAIVIALGMDELFEHFLPGKVMSLMAADVVAWHHSAGGSLHPDTSVWSSLPMPWDVLAGRKLCTRAAVERVCLAHRVDPVRGGWTRARERDGIVAYRATPELVHGVTVQSAHVAAILKKAGFFSGKQPAHKPMVASSKTT